VYLKYFLAQNEEELVNIKEDNGLWKEIGNALNN
jgi:hypothetical protein